MLTPNYLNPLSAMRVIAQCLADTVAVAEVCEAAGDEELARWYRAQATAYEEDLARWELRAQPLTGGSNAIPQI